MIDNTITHDALFKEDEIDLDQMAEEVERMRSIRGTTELKGNRALRDWLKPVGKVVRPSFGGRIEATRTANQGDGLDRFKCGR